MPGLDQGPLLIRSPAGGAPLVPSCRFAPGGYRCPELATESTGGANRFLPPVPKARMDGVFAADTVSPACPQALNPPHGATSISEDCLTVNVWRPTGVAEGDRRPVMLWIYGGSFTSGANQYPVYQGGYVATKEDVVLVMLNYRIGALGFLAGIEGLEGNQGLKDQQLAMRWVKDNIERFGGDPEHVTIYGESAGAMSVVPSVGGSAICRRPESLAPSSGTVNAGTQPGIPSRQTSVEGARTLLARADRSSSARTTRCTP